MNDKPSTSDLQMLLQTVPRTIPRIADTAGGSLGRSTYVLKQVGLPIRHADWFVAEEEITVFHDAQHNRYKVNDRSTEITDAVAIGRNDFGRIVVVCTTGDVVYIDETGQTQLINTSLERFLYFVGRAVAALRPLFPERPVASGNHDSFVRGLGVSSALST